MASHIISHASAFRAGKRGRTTITVLLAAAVLFGAAAPSFSGVTVESVVLTVNGIPVMRSEIFEAAGTNKLNSEQWQTLCRELAIHKLIEQIAEDEKIEVTDEEVERGLLNLLKSEGYNSLEEVPDEMRMFLGPHRRQIRRSIIQRRVLARRLQHKVVVLPREVKEYYDNNQDEFKVEERRRVRIITVVPETGGDPETARRLARQKIDQMREQLEQKPDSFFDLARSQPNAPFADKGGDWGWQTRSGLTEPLNSVAFSIEIGEISEVVQSPVGFHIIKVEERQLGHIQPFNAVEDRIRTRLSDNLQRTKIREFLENLYNNATIVIYDKGPEA